MDSEVLSLKWNNHRTTFLKVLLKLCLKDCHSDVTIICQGKYFPAHKLVLSTCSRYFEDIFIKTVCKHPFIIVNELKPEELEALMKFMYKGEVVVSQNSLPGLIKAAEILNIKGLAVSDEEAEREETHYVGKRKKGSHIDLKELTKKSNVELPVDKTADSPLSALHLSKDNDSAFINDNADEIHVIAKDDEQLADIKVETFDYTEDDSLLPEEKRSYINSLTEENYDLQNMDISFGSSSNQTKSLEEQTFSRFQNFFTSRDEGGTRNSTPLSSFRPDVGQQRNVTHANALLQEFRKVYQCQFCPYRCYNRSHSIYHMRKHTGERPFPCQICSKRFSVKHNLDRHIYTVHT